jgi:hypothetical protein
MAELKRCLGEAACLLRPKPIKPGEIVAHEFDLPLDYMGKRRRLRIAFTSSFPLEPAVFTVVPSPSLDWPHTMSNGLCLYTEEARPVTDTPEASIRYSYDQVAALIRLSLAGSDPVKRDAEFAGEIRSYWESQLAFASHRLTLVALPDKSHPLEVVSDHSDLQQRNQRYLIAPTHNQIAAFEKRLGRLGVKPRAVAQAGFFLKLIGTPPPRLPLGKGDFLNWVAPCVDPEDLPGFQCWLDHTSGMGSRWVVLALPSGPTALQAFYMTALGLDPKRRRVFGRRTQRRQAWRTDKPHALSLAPIDVLDPRVIHQRAGEAALALAQKKVVLIGAGSLGGELAKSLARAGVGRLVIVDPEQLEDANIGRHTLGALDLGRSKAQALADHINRDIPTAEVVAIEATVQSTSIRLAPHLADAEVVVVTTANWRSEAYLWAQKAAGVNWSLIQAWSEPHALVGHVLIAPPGAFDARSLFDRGVFRHRLTKWPRNGVIPLPACGQSYIPGGGVALGRIGGMIANCALRALEAPPNRPRWHTTVGDLDRLASLEGRYDGPAMPDGLTFFERALDWPATSDA